jgi:2-hydroxychromene-2-carboxylate isomerase
MAVVDLYFDYLSPFAYLATILGPDAVARHGATVHFRPVLFAALLNHWGQKGPAEIPPKAIHAFRTCLRAARLRNIPFRSPMYHPFNPLTALRATLACETDDERARAVHALFALGWAQGGDVADPASISAALTAASLDGPGLLAKASAPDMKQALRRETEIAIERGVFGIPTFVVNGALFWGLDQLEYVELALQGRDPISGVDLATLAPKGIGASRT